MRTRPVHGGRRVAACLTLVLTAGPCSLGQASPQRSLHYAPNGNFDASGNYLPAKSGFNLADVRSVEQLGALPDHVKGLVWIGQCNGVDARFRDTVRPYIGNTRVFGFFLMDDPDPRRSNAGGTRPHACKAEDLKAESDFIHAELLGARTFIVLMNLSSSRTPSFGGLYDPRNTHVDFFGIDPYPCRTELNPCDFEMIDRYVAAAESSGVPRAAIIPVSQAFGGGKWRNDGGGQYALPSVQEEQEILAHWRRLAPSPAFDMAYSWGTQNGDVALEGASDLQAVFFDHNTGQDEALK
jgi:hypothetical protein